jgi:hypothetical protein
LQEREAFGPRAVIPKLSNSEEFRMRKKTLAAALTGALALSMVGVAQADINDTTFELSQFSASPAKSGTKKKPKPVNFRLGVTGGTKSGTGQPSTSTSLKITLPKGLKWNGKAWAKGKRCAKNVSSDSDCPRGSRIGSGNVDAQALSTTEKITVTAYVLTNGNLGLWLEGTPLPLNTMLEGKVRGQVITVAIPVEIQQPVPGVPSSIRTLAFGLNGKTKVKGKTRGVIESTGCTGGKWNLKFQNVVTDGSLSDQRSVNCRK